MLLVGPLVVVARGQRSRQLDWVDPARLTDLAALPGGVAQSGAVGGLLLGLAALGAGRLGRRALLPAACVLLPVLLVFAAGVVVPLWVPRYLVFTVPFGCLLAGAAPAAYGWRRRSPWWCWPGCSACPTRRGCGVRTSGRAAPRSTTGGWPG
ncbi:hypothetical protein JNW87_33955 [Micromonospora sp. ATA51]|nr:hypothetical protein [Micromonospora sp. ATA51]